MNNLINTQDDIKQNMRVTTAAQIMAYCRGITPQFYKGLSRADLATEKASIELLTAHIDPPVLQKMCEMAVENYGIARSENIKTYFDINYILTFYRLAFNWVWCDCVEIPDDYDDDGRATFDEKTRIITERWYSKNGGADIIVKFIVKREYDDRYGKKWGTNERHHTPKYHRVQSKRREADWMSLSPDEI